MYGKNVITLFVLLLAIFSFLGYGKAQSAPSVLIYSENYDYLLPVIETTLKELRYFGSKKEVFSQVVNLNNINASIRDEGLLREVISYYSTRRGLKSIPTEADSLSREMEKLLSQFNYYLRVKPNPLEDLIEYQFFLYENYTSRLESQDENDLLAVWNAVAPIQVQSFFLNPRDEGYERELGKKLLSLFPQANFTPTAVVKVNGQEASNMKKMVFKTDSTIRIDASAIFDRDTRREDIVHNWRQIDVDGNIEVPEEDKIFLSDSSIQEISVSKEGIYLIGFSLYDGVTRTREDTIFIKTVNEPILQNNSRFVAGSRTKPEVLYHMPFILRGKTVTSSYTYNFFTNIPLNRVANLRVNRNDNSRIRLIEGVKHKEILQLEEYAMLSSPFDKSNSYGRQGTKFSITLESLQTTTEPEEKYYVSLLDKNENLKTNSLEIRLPFHTMSRFDIGYFYTQTRTKLIGTSDTLNLINNDWKLRSFSRGVVLGWNTRYLNFEALFRNNAFAEVGNRLKIRIKNSYRLYFPVRCTRNKRSSITLGLSLDRYEYLRDGSSNRSINKLNLSFKYTYRLFKWKYIPLLLQLTTNTRDKIRITDDLTIRTRFVTAGVLYNIGGI